MNELSIILYFADIAMNVMYTIFGFGLFFIFGFLVFNIFKAITIANHNHDNCYSMGDDRYRKYGIVRMSWLVVGLIMIVISNFIPSKQTMYMIAASEIGESVILSPEMNDTMGKVKTVVDLKLDDVIAELSNDKVEPAVENK